MVTKPLSGREHRVHVTNDVTKAHRLREPRLPPPGSGCLFCRTLLPSPDFYLGILCRGASEVSFRAGRLELSVPCFPDGKHWEAACPVGGQPEISALILFTSLCAVRLDQIWLLTDRQSVCLQDLKSSEVLLLYLKTYWKYRFLPFHKSSTHWRIIMVP